MTFAWLTKSLNLYMRKRYNKSNNNDEIFVFNLNRKHKNENIKTTCSINFANIQPQNTRLYNIILLHSETRFTTIMEKVTLFI